MNKKIIAGLMSAAAVGSFWACGSGNINEIDDVDTGVIQTFANTGYTSGHNDSMVVANLIATSKEKCAADITPGGCAETYAAYLSGQEVVAPTSSAGEIPNNSNNNNVIPPSSSSRAISTGPVVSSSSINIIGPDEGTSSAGGQGGTVVTGLGTCTTSDGKTAISKGESARFKFTLNNQHEAVAGNPQAVLDASYEWHYGNGTNDGTESKKTSSLVTFTESGEADISVTVNVGGSTETIACPLHINGDPITGCKCTTEETTVDYTATPTVAWNVSGCASGTHALTYAWDGAAGTTEFTKTFDAAQAGYAPALRVSSDDNSIVDVTCPAVKTTNGPEYQLGFEGQNIPSAADVSVPMPFNIEACINVNFTWENAGYQPTNISVLCDVTAAQGQPGLTMNVTYGTASKSYTGDYNISNSGIALGAITSGVNDKGNVCVTITGTEGGSAKCFFGN